MYNDDGPTFSQDYIAQFHRAAASSAVEWFLMFYFVLLPSRESETQDDKFQDFWCLSIVTWLFGFSHVFPTKKYVFLLSSMWEKRKSQEENFAVVQVNVNWDWEDEEMMTDDSNVPTIYSCCVSLFFNAVQVCNLHKGWDRDDIEERSVPLTTSTLGCSKHKAATAAQHSSGEVEREK